MSRILPIIIGCLLVSGCMTFGDESDYEMDSKEAKKGFESLLKIDYVKGVSEIQFYENSTGIDPYYYLKFKADTALVSRIIKLKDLKKNNGEYYNRPSAPNWFNPTTSNSILYYSKMEIGKHDEFLIYDESINTVFYSFSYM